MLVLNATYEPINVCSMRRAVVLLLKEKAEMVEQGARALFDAGYGSSLIGRRRSVSAREKASRQKAPRRASKASKSRPLPTGKGEIELRP